MSPTDKFVDDIVNTNNNDGEKRDEVLPFPHKIVKLDKETNQELLNVFKGEQTGFLQVGSKKWFFPSGYEKNAHHYYNFEARPDDVFIVTFPRSGTTWTQEMVWLLANDMDYRTAAELSLLYRFPFLEFSSFVHKETKAEILDENQLDAEKYEIVDLLDYPVWKQLAETKERRFIKTHLPFSLLPPNLLDVGCKVIYVARNPKDVAVSFYHLNRSFRTQGYIGDFPRYWNYFRRNLQPWCPYWEHLKEGWNRRHEKNLLFLFYEEMNKNLRGSLEKVAKFLGKSYTNEEYSNLEEHLKIDNFRTNKSVNQDDLKSIGVLLSNEESFVRKGQTGGWRQYFDEKLEAEADKWIEENLLDTDLRFPQILNK